MQYMCGRMSRAAQKRSPGRGSQRLHRALGGTRILLAAAPTAPPCFCRRQRSSLLHRGFFPAGPFGGSYELRLPLFPQPLGRALKKRSAAPASPPCFRRRRRSAPLLFESTRSMSLALLQNKNLSVLYTLRFLGGRGWIRTTEAESSRFTVCPHWPLGNTPIFVFYSRVDCLYMLPPKARFVNP